MQRSVPWRVWLQPFTVCISIFRVPRWKTMNGNRKETARIPQSSISLSTGKDGECQSSRNTNYIQDKYTAIRHVHTIKIFVSCNYHRIRWDAGRYTMNFLILQMNDWLKNILASWRLTVKVILTHIAMAGCWFCTVIQVHFNVHLQPGLF